MTREIKEIRGIIQEEKPKPKTGQATAVWFGLDVLPLLIDTSMPGYGSSEYFLSTSTTTVVLLLFKHKWPGYGIILKQEFHTQ